MARLTGFRYNKKTHFDRKLILSVCCFLTIIILFYIGFSSVSESTQRRQRESLENAINRNIAHYYATEGCYPASLDMLVKKYGLTYDRDRFFVDYRLQGANIYPDVTIIEEED